MAQVSQNAEEIEAERFYEISTELTPQEIPQKSECK